MKRCLSLAAGAFLALAQSRPLPAQSAAADTPELARAVAAVLTDSVLEARARKEPLVWRSFGLPLDSAVSRILGGHPRLRAPVADSAHAMWMGIDHVERDADTARVVVRRGRSPKGNGPLTFWFERTPYVFARVRDGWRFVRSEFTSHADGGEVRGDRLRGAAGRRSADGLSLAREGGIPAVPAAASAAFPAGADPLVRRR